MEVQLGSFISNISIWYRACPSHILVVIRSKKSLYTFSLKRFIFGILKNFALLRTKSYKITNQSALNHFNEKRIISVYFIDKC